MKQIKLLGVLAIALALGLSSCGKGAEESSGGDNTNTSEQQGSSSEEHVHTFEDAWTSNSSKHWHKATCGHNVKGDEAEHTFGDPYDIEPATCTENGSQKRKCSVCDYVKNETLPKLNHDEQPAEGSDAWTIVRNATCTVDGLKTYHCSKCDTDVEVTIPSPGHQFKKNAEGEDLIEWTTEPTCTDAGTGGHRTCDVCGEEVAVSSTEAAALGHDFKKDAEGNIEFTWTVEPTCEQPGRGTKHCNRCNQNIAATDEERAALGHDITAIGGETTPTDGTAAVRLYSCSRCHDVFMGFAANEVTNESKTHVRFEPATVTEGQEQGARFLGRPIGNALALNSDGDSVNKQNEECVYCSTETGDFIEYHFRLNAQQAATLATCRCYIDAKPANYLNGKDFFACGSGDEYTRGFYIDGGAERFETNEDGTPKMVQDHEKAAFDETPGAAKVDGEGNPVMVQQGKPIEDFRYVLYVDDQVVDFDDTENPTHGNNTNMTREEFVMPYTFHLKEGLNKIKLVMAGGYRSLLYRFVFRPYVEPTPVTVSPTTIEVREGETAQITSEMTELSYKSGNTSIATVDATGKVTGVKRGSTTITVSKDGNYKDAKVTVKVLPPVGIIAPELTDGVIAPADGVAVYNSSSSGTWYRNPKKDATITYRFQCEEAGKYDIKLGLRDNSDPYTVLAENMSIKVNGVDVAIGDITVQTSYNAVEFTVGQVDLELGECTMVITFLADSDLYLKTLELSLAPEVPEHVHAWNVGEKATDSALRAVTCTCEETGYELQAADLTAGQKAPVSSDKNTRLGKNSIYDDVWNITGIAAGTYDIYLDAQVSSGNDNAYWNAKTAQDNGDSASNNGSGSTDFRYKVKIDDAVDYLADFGSATDSELDQYSDFGLSNAARAWTTKPVARITIAAGATSITIHNMNNGYAIWIYGMRLMSVAA